MRKKLNLIVFTLVLFLDQATKLLACIYLKDGEPVPVCTCFNLTLVFNPGAAFGMFSRLPDFWRRAALIAVSFVALFVVLWFMFKELKEDKLGQTALAAILAGALGNIVDRFRFDAVVDFLDFYWKNYHWPAFNVADSAISVGVALLMLRFLLPSARRKFSAD